MYKRILVPLENSACDRVILDHVAVLAKFCDASIVLFHVADGFVARNYKELNLRESEEMQKDRAYLESMCAELAALGLDADPLLGGGDPAEEIVGAAALEGCDLIAMATHGHRGIADVIHGSTANEVRHMTAIPVLMVRKP